MERRRLWAEARDELVSQLEQLGFPAELGECIARHLGSPRAIVRMTSWLHYEQPHSAELIVDEMLAIRSEIDAWREKKAAQEANERLNERLHRR